MQVINADSVKSLVIHQIRNYWDKVDEELIRSYVPEALRMMEDNFSDINSGRFTNERGAIFNPLMSVHWAIFLYRVSNLLWKNGGGTAADQVYYLNKIMHSVDWFYQIELPIHFLCEHPLGSVLGRAQYGDHLLIYQGTTVGGSMKDGKLCYPQFEDNVIMFANSSILGNSKVGSNVMISAGARVLNQNIPSNAIVFGNSPDLVIKDKDEKTMKRMIEEYWK